MTNELFLSKKVNNIQCLFFLFLFIDIELRIVFRDSDDDAKRVKACYTWENDFKKHSSFSRFLIFFAST